MGLTCQKGEMDMLQRPAVIMVTTLDLAGCAAPAMEDNDKSKIGSVPEAVAVLAAPDQNRITAHLLPEDTCYWYEHSGSGKTTLEPLQSTSGNPICFARQS